MQRLEVSGVTFIKVVGRQWLKQFEI